MKRIRVTKENIKEAMHEIRGSKTVAFDIETTGLDPIKDRVFAFAVTNEHNTWYFSSKGLPDFKVPELMVKLFMSPTFGDYEGHLVAHNAIFESSFMISESIRMGKKYFIDRLVVCTKEAHTLLTSSNSGRSLERLAQVYKVGSKSKEVEKYIIANGLYDKKDSKGKLVNPRYQDVPDDMIFEYCSLDAELCYNIVKKQTASINKMYDAVSSKRKTVLSNEVHLPFVLADMKVRGLGLDVDYLKKQEVLCIQKIQRLELELNAFLPDGVRFKDTPTVLSNIFNHYGWPIVLTEKGRPSFSGEVILKSSIPSKFKNLLIRYRWFHKIYSTYIAKQIELHKDKKGIVNIHPDFQQNGAMTGRFTAHNPAIQTFPSESLDGIDIRKAIVPGEGGVFVSFDWSQQEYRLFLDYLGNKEMIGKVNKGLDFHDETAKMLGLSRKIAKCYNFAFLYGSGVRALAKTTGSTVQDVERVMKHYKKILPEADKFIASVKKAVIQRGSIINWAGRVVKVHMKESYKGVNYLIQSGGADIVKRAMQECHNYLLLCSAGVKLVLNVHDELVYTLPSQLFKSGDGRAMLARLKSIMEEAYIPKNGIKMKVDVSYGTSLSKESFNVFEL